MKTCYECEEYRLCCCRRAFWNLITTGGFEFLGEDLHKALFSALAYNCLEYKK